MIEYILRNRDEFNLVTILYGARRPSMMLYRYKLHEWKYKINTLLTVDEPEPGWNGYVGVVTLLFNKINEKYNIAMICGPPVMMKYASMSLLKLGLSPKDIFISLERNMRCGIGFCGHCAVSGIHVCKDGPVFPLYQALKLIEIPYEVRG